MPRPSSNVSDTQSPRLFPSTCPESEEYQRSEVSSHTEFQGALSPESLSDWQPHAASQDLGGDGPSSPLHTMSPGPQSEGVRDVEMGNDGERLPSPMRDEMDESHKRTDSNEAALTMRARSSRSLGNVRACDTNIRPVKTKSSGEPPGTSKQASDALPRSDSKIHNTDMWDMGRGPRWVEDSGLAGLAHEYSHMRLVLPNPSCYLRPGTRFVGTQQSKRQKYAVEVEFKHIDIRESFLCGYLRIQGLTSEDSTLITYFEGEIIGTKYGFITEQPAWGATPQIDVSHWEKFSPFEPYKPYVRKGQVYLKDAMQREYIFMRWKEHFLVPDHRVKMISGASFEGFYYICFNQIEGDVKGIYYHSRSEDFQQLELKCIQNRGLFASYEFR